MSGMGTTLQTNNTTIVDAFHSSLLRQSLIAAAILALLALAWSLLRAEQLRRGALAHADADAGVDMGPGGDVEPAGRHLLRVAFGVFWLFDGLLQLQASMPLG